MSSEPLLAGQGGKGPPLQPALEDFEARVVIESLPPRPSTRRRLYEGAFWLGLPLLLGVAIGLAVPTSDRCPVVPNLAARLSSIIGWVYFCAWSISFYPQAFLNWRRKSVAGLSLDFQLLNMLGFGCYAVYNGALFWNPTVREQYSCTHGGSLPAVHANDVFFAIHAAVVTGVTLFQCAIYERGGQRISWLAGLGTAGSIAGIAAYLAAVIWAQQGSSGGGHVPPGHTGLTLVPTLWFRGSSGSGSGSSGGLGGGALPCGDLLSWLSFLYFLSYIKLAVSLVKYIPQVILNWRLRSTAGWNMHNVALDFGGGMLSLVQLLMDGAYTQDWTAVTGNPVKFALGFASIFFDVIFMVQHFCLYPAHAEGQFWQEPSQQQQQQQQGNRKKGLPSSSAISVSSSSGRGPDTPSPSSVFLPGVHLSLWKGL
ncbi:Lysosomal Cystine Transporter (LCT) Family [Chlorella sorokiniana]|uniref:Lysosomal Cystine Transporter (LCT) Family n=1 Tax=Chlorella sorokiniana TaxID=3076 RepID=A0A2P6TEB2_CHLSO|nr:Lysosomal Cystine Transporter (LCT) Family [Chlorella sorokiniana]|eukprot:PRW20981.1 Lysosomal Cystine Transporter (LCT) Family [Chlorella sorokiniana]